MSGWIRAAMQQNTISHIPSLEIVEGLNFIELLYDGAMERKQMFSAFMS